MFSFQGQLYCIEADDRGSISRVHMVRSLYLHVSTSSPTNSLARLPTTMAISSVEIKMEGDDNDLQCFKNSDQQKLDVWVQSKNMMWKTG